MTTVILLPFSKSLVAIAEGVIKDDDSTTAFLDTRLLLTPAVAIAECRKKSVAVLRNATDGYMRARIYLHKPQ